MDSRDPYNIGYHNPPSFYNPNHRGLLDEILAPFFFHLKMQARNNSFIATSHCLTLALALITELTTTSSITCKIPDGGFGDDLVRDKEPKNWPSKTL